MPTYALGIHTRNVIGEMFSDLNYTVGAEIGVHKGLFAKEILDKWNGHLHLIDPWNIPIGYEQQAIYLEGSGPTLEQRLVDYAQCVENLVHHRERITFYKYLSQEALPLFRDNSLDFVYIDGDHRAESVHSDLQGWYPKIRRGGMVAGHDWLMPGEEDHSWGKGIQRMVARFCDMKAIDTVYLVPENDGLPWSFYFFVNK